MELSGRTILITGATAGIGMACAKMFAEQGASLILTGRRSDRLQALAEQLSPEKTHILTLDMRDRDAVLQQLTHLPEPFSQVDALINNAGLARGLEPFHKMPLGDLEQMVDTNIKGLIYATHSLLPGMIERGRGHIINLGSIAGTYPYPGGHVYGGTKSFCEQFTLGLKADLLGTPVKVTNIEPGMVDTEFSTIRFGDKSQADEVYAGMQPLIAEDIAETIHWCLTRPQHVNINRIEIMPVAQAFSPFSVDRGVVNPT